MDSAHANEGDIGYELSPDYWGRGFATEAAKAMLGLGFREFGLHRISSWCVAVRNS
ncbi:MAG: N-acetyltransferase [Gammaproteobacteria bacterium]|nr:MAG: N-acetyltransferase [Gammaproteobacteria bacterium]